jgi:uncharacterized protein DUF2188
VTPRKTYEVRPHPNGGWMGQVEGGARPSVVAPTKAVAIQRTIEIAKRQPEASVRIKGRDGRVQEERTYPRSSDPYPPKG